jgi:hypothetical protein
MFLLQSNRLDFIAALLQYGGRLFKNQVLMYVRWINVKTVKQVSYVGRFGETAYVHTISSFQTSVEKNPRLWR